MKIRTTLATKAAMTLALVAAALAVSPSAFATQGESAAGAGTYPYQSGSADFNFQATGGTDWRGGGATGTMTWTSRSSTGAVLNSWTAAVRCLWVDEGQAKIVGVVTAATALPVGGVVTFHATDLGAPGAGLDRFVMTALAGDSPEFCIRGFPPGIVITTGEIVVVDVIEPDSEDDGIPDAFDTCPTVDNFFDVIDGIDDPDGNGIGARCEDQDADGVLPPADNCPTVSNPGQNDIDHDGLGDACDPLDNRSAEEQLADLIAALQNAPLGPGNSFLAKLNSIAASLQAGNAGAACNKLRAFENEVRAQTGKKLTQAEADSLLAASTAIRSASGCP